MTGNPLPARIAWRYLVSKKSHSAVGAISVVSICGIAVATAAIICVLSVFNGFKSVISDRIDTLTPDLMITPSYGKVIANGDSLANAIASIPEVEIAAPSILENALALYEGRETPILLKGIDIDAYNRLTGLDRLIVDRLNGPLSATSVPSSADEEMEEDILQPSPTVLSVGTAARLGASPGAGVLLFAPRREGRVNLANPISSFFRDSVEVRGVYRSNQSDFDDNRVVVGLEVARDLLQYDSESSAVEVKVKDGKSADIVAEKIDRLINSASVSDNDPNHPAGKYIIKNRLQQQEMNFRMISIEKWVTFLLLIFILIIASFNIISSLSMLVIEKEKSMSTLRALGMTRGRIASVFRWESVYVTLIGGIAGLAIGLGLCFLQQTCGLIRLQGDPGSLVIRAYPVLVDPLDILITLIPLFLIGLATALVTGAFARNRI